MKLCDMSLYDLNDMLEKKEVSAEEITVDVLKRINTVGIEVGGYITLQEEQTVLENAREADKRISENKRIGKIDGIPYALKDNMCTTGLRTTCASKILENFISPYNCAVYDYLENAGGVLIGKADMDEFAMGSSTENSALAVTRNPWNYNKVPGGSSGGSAAVVASGQAIFSLGSDTGGSIRLPASFCGITGLKPTYSAVSRYGLVAFASSLDQIGPLTKDARDMAIVLDHIIKYDNRDSTSVMVSTDYSKNLSKDIKGLRIGVDMAHYEGLDEEIKKAVFKAIDIFKSHGCEIIDLSFTHNDIALSAYYIISSAEASSNLARFDGVKYGMRIQEENIIDTYTKTRSLGFGKEVKRRIMLGTFVLSSGYYDAYYKKALQARTLIKHNFDEAFKLCDVVITPTAVSGAFDRGRKIEDPTQVYLSDIYTVTANIAGIPAMSIPCGFTNENMPIGLQLMANAYCEQTLLNAAYAYQETTDFHKQLPKSGKEADKNEI